MHGTGASLTKDAADNLSLHGRSETGFSGGLPRLEAGAVPMPGSGSSIKTSLPMREQSRIHHITRPGQPNTQPK